MPSSSVSGSPTARDDRAISRRQALATIATGERRWFDRLGFRPTSLGVADGVVVAGGRQSVAIVTDTTRG